jgi:predicted N-acetyltransferase YhbS
MNISIRKLLPQDIPQVLRILSLWNLEPVAPSPECPDPEKSSISIDTAFVAVDEDLIVGIGSYRILSSETAETMSLAVAPEYKGKGIGYLLQRARLREMKEKGIRIVRTDTDRPETIQWYINKFGYKIIGHKKKKHPSSLLDIDSWTVLELDLEQSPL